MATQTKPYKVTFKTMVGRTFKSEGTTLEKALKKIKASGGEAKAGGVLKVTKGSKVREKIVSGRAAHGIFGQGGPTSKLIHMKGVLALFDI